MRAGFFHPESQLGIAPVSCLVELQYKRLPQRIGEKPKSQPELRCTWMLNRVFFIILINWLLSIHTSCLLGAKPSNLMVKMSDERVAPPWKTWLLLPIQAENSIDVNRAVITGEMQRLMWQELIQLTSEDNDSRRRDLTLRHCKVGEHWCAESSTCLNRLESVQYHSRHLPYVKWKRDL